MDPVLLTLASPQHDLQTVGAHVVRDNLRAYLHEIKGRTGARELFYLATCQRVLWVLWGGDPEKIPLTLPHGKSPLLFEGELGWQHLVSLGSGLSSANPGDLDIPNQLRRAIEDSLSAESAGEECRQAMEDVLRECGRLRSRLGLDRGSVSVASVALRQITQNLEPGAKVALVGTGAMTQYLAERLPSRGFHVTIVNRTLENALLVAQPLGLHVIALSHFQKNPEDFDAAVSATGAPFPVFLKRAWEGLNRSKNLLFIDLALPPDSEEAVGDLPWVSRLTLEDCLQETEQTKAIRRSLAEEASPILTESAQRLHVKARHRGLRRERQQVHQELTKAWNLLEQECHHGILATLNEEQRNAMLAALQRGRTLAFRALAQGHVTCEAPPEALLPQPAFLQEAIP